MRDGAYAISDLLNCREDLAYRGSRMNGLPVFLPACIREILFEELCEGDFPLRVFLVFCALRQFSAWKAWAAFVGRGDILSRERGGVGIHLGLVVAEDIRLDLVAVEYNHHLGRIDEEDNHLDLVVVECIRLGPADEVNIPGLLAGAENKVGGCHQGVQTQVFGNEEQHLVDVRVGLSKGLLYRSGVDILRLVEEQNSVVVAQGGAEEGEVLLLQQVVLAALTVRQGVPLSSLLVVQARQGRAAQLSLQLELEMLLLLLQAWRFPQLFFLSCRLFDLA